jgi:Domain of unknown function (DUF4352)
MMLDVIKISGGQETSADKFCANCGKKNKADAVICSKCNTPFASSSAEGQGGGATPVVIVQQKKGGFFRKFGIGCFGLIAVIVVVIIIAAVVGGSKSGSSGPTSKTASVGGTIHVPDNLDVTLNSFDLSNGNQIETPKTGNEFVITHWTFHNFRSSNTDVADTGYSVESNGVISNSTSISSLTKNALGISGTTLAPGATVQRDIVFEIAKGATAKIIYKPSDFTANWNLQG